MFSAVPITARGTRDYNGWGWGGETDWGEKEGEGDQKWNMI